MCSLFCIHMGKELSLSSWPVRSAVGETAGRACWQDPTGFRFRVDQVAYRNKAAKPEEVCLSVGRQFFLFRVDSNQFQFLSQHNASTQIYLSRPKTACPSRHAAFRDMLHVRFSSLPRAGLHRDFTWTFVVLQKKPPTHGATSTQTAAL